MCLFEFDQEKYERTVKNEGLIEGREEERKNTVKRMLSKGYTKNQIMDLTGYDEKIIDSVLQ